jgi:spore coat polysaccharide biosynthesis protein SpsF
MNIVAIIAARMASTRLPGKVMIDISGKPVLQHVIEGVRGAKKVDKVVILTTKDERNEEIVRLAEELEVDYFRGSDEDALGSFLLAAKKANADILVRVTGDCPFIEPTIIDKVIELHIKKNADYSSTLVDEGNEESFPRGVDTEVFSIETLKKVHELGHEQYYRDHVTPFILQHPELFKIQIVKAPVNLRRHFRLTVDTQEDLRLIREIFSRLQNQEIDIYKVIKLLDKEKKLPQINANIKQKAKADYSKLKL